MIPLRFRLRCYLLLLFLLVWGSSQLTNAETRQNPEGEIRALWVTRWDYANRGDIAKIMADAASLNLTTVFFQVRGNATVYYPSRFEPWDEALGGGDPNWNPLAEAISQAREQGLRLHAWINVFPGWRGVEPPNQGSQIFSAHPDWFMVDQDKNPMALNAHYVWLNPALPAVQNHLSRVVMELAGTPGLSGIHFDYFRYPGPGFSFDDATESAFRDQAGQSPKTATPAWDRFRRDAISGWLRATARRIRSDYADLVLSSAVIGAYDLGPKVFMQDAHNWLTEGIIDYIVPMTYTSDDRLLARWLNRHGTHRNKARVLPGLMIYPDLKRLNDQIQMVRDQGFKGYSLFAYKSLLATISGTAGNDSIRTILASNAPGAMSPNGASGLLISEVLWSPERPMPQDSIRIVCRVDGRADDDKISLIAVWSNDSQSLSERLPMRQSPSNSNYWYATKMIPPHRAGADLFLRIYAFENNRYDQAVASDLMRIPVDASRESYQATGETGPLMTLAIKGAIDDQDNVWLDVPGEGIRIIKADGSELPGSPRDRYRDGGRIESLVDKVAGITTMSDGNIGILVKENGRNLFMSSRAEDPVFGLVAVLPQAGLDIAKAGRFLFVLTNESWFVTGLGGQKIGEVELAGFHTVNNIAVTPNGRDVYVACRTEGTVHHWYGYISSGNLKYTALADLDVGTMSLGRVTVADDGTLFLAATAAGHVRVLDSDLRVLDLLMGGQPALRAPRLVLATRDKRAVYVLETGGTTPVRMQKWISTEIPTN